MKLEISPVNVKNVSKAFSVIDTLNKNPYRSTAKACFLFKSRETT